MATTPSPLWFHLLAGPNGAGKSTLYRALVREGILGPPLEFVNADLYEREHLQHITGAQQRSEAARAWAEARRADLLAAHTPFASETVFSHPSKLTLMEEAQRHGFTVALHIVALDDPARLLDRVGPSACTKAATPCRPNASWRGTRAPWTTWRRRLGWRTWRIFMTRWKRPREEDRVRSCKIAFTSKNQTKLRLKSLVKLS